MFLEPNAIKLNNARMEHLASLNLAIAGKRVLEVGGGIGLLTPFFDELGCDVLSTEARPDNVKEMARRRPGKQVDVLDLDTETDLSRFGQFDIVFCYGTLYHLANPRGALQAMAGACSDMLLLETCTSPGTHVDSHPVRESQSINQALRLIGCRPTRPWIMEQLKELWGYAYISNTQPNSDEFETDWATPSKHGNHRAVFVGSRNKLSNSTLADEPAATQPRIIV